MRRNGSLINGTKPGYLFLYFMPTLKRSVFNFSEKILRKKFYYLSDPKHRNLYNCNEIIQPCLFKGAGKIDISKAFFGVVKSPQFYNSYSYLEARNSSAAIVVGEKCRFSNNICIIAESEEIIIGNKCIVGANVSLASWLNIFGSNN